ncbi:MAG: signal peptide peptidase SppA [Chloroflexota bacterium]|nr:signal peptide peptidase SppA [Dehalococcoidia bacterium]MDW8252371.1 signal peptide peptidase SppA [Chloroflexota bacterium]
MRRGLLWALGLVTAALFLFGACGVGFLLGVAVGGTVAPFSAPAVAVIEVTGPITSGEGDPFAGGMAGSAKIVRWIEQAADDPRVRAIVLRIDSPGGDVTAADEIYNAVVKAKAKEKKVVASFGSMAASGGYYIAAPADRIVANPTSITGSIGVISVIPDVSGLLAKLGVESYIFKSGPHKDSSSGLRPLTESDRRIWQSIIDDVYERFIEVVAKGRGMDTATVRALADGRILTGRQALQVKLVDELGDLPEAIRTASELAGISGEPSILTYRDRGFFAALASSWLRPPWSGTMSALGLDVRAPVQYRLLP